jgi:hypothetical protein
MISLRGLGNLGSGGGSARLAANYYEEHSADYYIKDLDQYVPIASTSLRRVLN